MKRADKANNNKNTMKFKNTLRRSIFSAYFLKNSLNKNNKLWVDYNK